MVIYITQMIGLILHKVFHGLSKLLCDTESVTMVPQLNICQCKTNVDFFVILKYKPNNYTRIILAMMSIVLAVRGLSH